ncbi:MAG: dTMP kinase [Fervidobacterium sp.]|nr:dTMP kinase [Fervidobacterium sp.]
MFVSFEGIDGCGKSTQVELFTEYLKSKNLDFVKVREPGGTELGEKIRQLLINQQMCARSELLLFLASRAQLVEEIIKPALRNKKVVVADRFAHSSLAYQGCGRELGIDTVQLLNDFATDKVYPDIVFFIDVSVDIAMSRIKNTQKDRIEREERDFWEKIRDCYIELAKKEAHFVIINGERDPESIHRDIVNSFENFYKKMELLNC